MRVKRESATTRARKNKLYRRFKLATDIDYKIKSRERSAELMRIRRLTDPDFKYRQNQLTIQNNRKKRQKAQELVAKREMELGIAPSHSHAKRKKATGAQKQAETRKQRKLEAEFIARIKEQFEMMQKQQVEAEFAVRIRQQFATLTKQALEAVPGFSAGRQRLLSLLDKNTAVAEALGNVDRRMEMEASSSNARQRRLEERNMPETKKQQKLREVQQEQEQELKVEPEESEEEDEEDYIIPTTQECGAGAEKRG